MSAITSIRPSSPYAAWSPELRLAAHRERALILEDDSDLRPLFRRALQRLDPEIRMDWTGRVSDGLRLLRRNSYRMVIADYLLEDGSGLLVRTWLNAFQPETRFAMTSAIPLFGTLRGPDASTIPFLPKPFSADQLREFLASMRADA